MKETQKSPVFSLLFVLFAAGFPNAIYRVWGPHPVPAHPEGGHGGRPYTPHTSHSAEGPLREIPHYSSILSFHHSAPNKPNFGPGRRKDKCRVDKEL
jgi:hypothetical protein